MQWTEENVERLKRMCGDGFSASEMARELGGGCSRNAVIGKLHRLKLRSQRPLRSSPPKPHGNAGQPKARSIVARAARRNREGGARAQLNAARAQKGIKFGAGCLSAPRSGPGQPLGGPAGTPLAPDERLLASDAWKPLPGTTPVPLLASGRDACKWPIGDPREPDFGFCGCPIESAPRSGPGQLLGGPSGKPYCAIHARRAVTIPQPERQKVRTPVAGFAELRPQLAAELA